MWATITINENKILDKSIEYSKNKRQLFIYSENKNGLIYSKMPTSKFVIIVKSMITAIDNKIGESELLDITENKNEIEATIHILIKP